MFYPTNLVEYNTIIERKNDNGLEVFESKNPYWKDNGVMIKDPDGFQIIISNLKSKK